MQRPEMFYQMDFIKGSIAMFIFLQILQPSFVEPQDKNAKNTSISTSLVLMEFHDYKSGDSMGKRGKPDYSEAQ